VALPNGMSLLPDLLWLTLYLALITISLKLFFLQFYIPLTMSSHTPGGHAYRGLKTTAPEVSPNHSRFGVLF
jgi:hypothetical protein